MAGCPRLPKGGGTASADLPGRRRLVPAGTEGRAMEHGHGDIDHPTGSGLLLPTETRVEISYPDQESWVRDWRRLRRLGWQLRAWFREGEGITAEYIRPDADR